MIEWKNVSFKVPHGFWMRSRCIIQQLNIALPEGTAMGLIGPNGAGKTTTIKLGAGLLRPTAGEVLIQGNPAVLPYARKEIGLMTETQYIYPLMRLREWVQLGAELSGLTGARLKKRVAEVLELVGLSERSDQVIRTLSKGQMQRAGLALALVHEPSILILDEPMSGLDPLWRFRLQKILLDFKDSGGTLLFSSHILSDLERITDHVALIENGKLRWKGRLKNLTREIKGYDVACRINCEYVLDELGSLVVREPQPDGSWRLSIPDDCKKNIIQLASSGRIDIEAMRPIRQEIEEVLFGINSDSEIN